ncbi:Uncharacterised protein [Mycobacteroides abscessus subsp. abscessus]|nr:Uncharacterised protein [Mycobacteroides abscessus subsp. abscessus]
MVVTNRFEDEADGPDCDADRADDSEGAKLVHRELDGQRHHENENALEAVDFANQERNQRSLLMFE